MNYLFTLLFFLFCTFSFGQKTTLNFDQDSYKLTPSSFYALNKLSDQVLKSGNKNEMGIIGHTDSDASDSYNEELALKRAHAVRDYLMKKGLKNRFSLFSHGEKNGLNNNLTDEEKKVNRRVEIILNFSGAVGFGTGANAHQSTLQMMEEIDQDPQVFVIDPRKGGELTTKHGTIVTIDPRVFKTELFATPIEIQIKEYYDKDRFVLGNMTTQDENGETIESRGMVNIIAIQKEDTLVLKRGSTVGIFFPDRKLNDGTEMFWGLLRGKQVVWKQMTFTTAENNMQEGGETNWYEEGAYVRRTRFRYEEIDGDWNKISRTEIKNEVTFDTVLVTAEQIREILTFRSPVLGRINCDRFNRNTGPKEDLVVQMEEDFQPEIYMVFDDIFSVMSYSYRENNKFVFTQIPIGTAVTIVAMHKNEKENNVDFAVCKSKAKENFVANLKFEKISKDELKEKLSEVRGEVQM